MAFKGRRAPSNVCSASRSMQGYMQHMRPSLPCGTVLLYVPQIQSAKLYARKHVCTFNLIPLSRALAALDPDSHWSLRDSVKLVVEALFTLGTLVAACSRVSRRASYRPCYRPSYRPSYRPKDNVGLDSGMESSPRFPSSRSSIHDKLEKPPSYTNIFSCPFRPKSEPVTRVQIHTVPQGAQGPT